jgi:uncharacterized cysteine cluster protein YcgN (CxxCxxCC family)
MNPPSKVKKHLRSLEEIKPLEQYCVRCGDCCHLTVTIRSATEHSDRILVPDLPCKFLVGDGDGRFDCSVYEDRFSLAPWCQNLHRLVESGLATDGCPYVEGAAWYRGSKRLSPQLLGYMSPQIKEVVVKNSAPFRPEDVWEFLNK